MLDYLKYWLREILDDLERYRQRIYLTPREALIEVYTAVFICAVVVVLLVSCANVQQSDPGRLMKLYCKTIETHYMNSETIKRLVSRGVDPCDCVGVRGQMRSYCTGRGPQIVPGPKTVFKG